MGETDDDLNEFETEQVFQDREGEDADPDTFYLDGAVIARARQREAVQLLAEIAYEEEFEELQETPTYHRMDIVTRAAAPERHWAEGEGAVVRHETDDNLDRGYPSEWATWETPYPTAEAALKACGKTRVGVSGCRVTVTLDGEEVR